MSMMNFCVFAQSVPRELNFLTSAGQIFSRPLFLSLFGSVYLSFDLARLENFILAEAKAESACRIATA